MLSSVAHASGGKGEEKVKVHHGRRTGSTFMFTKSDRPPSIHFY